jgi:ABC-type sugar transport system substrate-binding protein
VVGISVNDESIGLEEGRAAGTFTAEKWPGEEVQAIILDYPEFASLVLRADAIEQGLAETNPNATVVERYIGGTPDNGVTSTETALQEYPNLRLLTGINDAGDLGGYQALEAAGKTPDDVAVFGIDCDPSAKELIDQDTMYQGCVDTNPVGTGELAGAAVAKVIAGSTVPGSVLVPVFTYTGS